MNTRRAATVRRITAVAATTGLVGLLAAAPGFADGTGSGPGVHVVNTETVQVYLNAKGGVQSKRVYEQIALTGHGNVDLANPISTDGLRNLDGFGGFDVKGNDQIVETSVDGTKHYRSVSNFDGNLPVSVTPEYYLDGERVNPGDIVGKSGSLRVQFTVKNLTTQKQRVSYPDGHGGTTTSTAEVPVPMVGSLTTDLPTSFTHVQPGGANTAGDGTGGTTMSYTMTLFPPIGSTTARFGYTADITNGVVPDVNISMLPVDPMASPTFKSAADSYKGGADTGAQLVDGAGQIDTNLLKLRDGAATLLAGLIKLRNGADQLHTGLADTAAPGAKKLADGAGQLDSGLGKINDGAQQLAGGSGQLADGARRLSVGAGDAYAGSTKLSSGATKLSNKLGLADAGGSKLDSGAALLASKQGLMTTGLQQLRSGVKDLPAQVKLELEGDGTPEHPGNAEYLSALGALDGVVAATDPSGPLYQGLESIRHGLRAVGTTDCGTALAGGEPQNCGAMDAVQLISSQLTSGASSLDQLKPVLSGLGTALACGAFTPPQGQPATPCELLSTVYFALFSPSPTSPGLQGQAAAAGAALKTVYQKVDYGITGQPQSDPRSGGLTRVELGLSNPYSDPAKCAQLQGTAQQCGIQQVATALRAGVPQLVTQLTQSIQAQLLANVGDGAQGCDPTKTLLCAAMALQAGGQQLSGGMSDLAAGLAKLDAGGLQLADGAGTLASGLGQIKSGAGDLSTGANKLGAGARDLADGTSKAKDGSNQLAGGANQLAGGLGDAADGSGQIADGLRVAAGGAPQLVDGAQRLSTEGMGQLIKAGESTANNYGEMYAVMQAGAERAHTHSMAFGAPKGAQGLTAYSFVMRGDDGESGRNLTRGIAALVLLGLGAGAFALRRRLA